MYRGIYFAIFSIPQSSNLFSGCECVLVEINLIDYLAGKKMKVKARSNGSVCDGFSLMCILINHTRFCALQFKNKQLLTAYDFFYQAKELPKGSGRSLNHHDFINKKQIGYYSTTWKQCFFRFLF